MFNCNSPDSALLCSRQSVGWKRQQKHSSFEVSYNPSALILPFCSYRPHTHSPSTVMYWRGVGPAGHRTTEGQRGALISLLPASHHPHPAHEIRQACPLCFLSKACVCCRQGADDKFCSNDLFCTPTFAYSNHTAPGNVLVRILFFTCDTTKKRWVEKQRYKKKD